MGAAIILVAGDLYGTVRARHLSRAILRNIRQNLVSAVSIPWPCQSRPAFFIR